MDEMVQKYLDDAEVVYGVRSRRDTGTLLQAVYAAETLHLMDAPRISLSPPPTIFL